MVSRGAVVATWLSTYGFKAQQRSVAEYLSAMKEKSGIIELARDEHRNPVDVNFSGRGAVCDEEYGSGPRMMSTKRLDQGSCEVQVTHRTDRDEAETAAIEESIGPTLGLRRVLRGRRIGNTRHPGIDVPMRTRLSARHLRVSVAVWFAPDRSPGEPQYSTACVALSDE